jgi:hypothetical protein
MDEINQKEDFDPRIDFLLRIRTCPGGLTDKSEKPYWNLVKRSDIWDDQNWTVRFAKLDIWGKQDRELKRNLGKTWGAERNKKDIDIIHIGSYHLENGILDITMSFQFIHLWTKFDNLNWENEYLRNLIQEKDIMDLRDISSLMASQQAIKMNNSHEWIDMVTKTEKLQIF